MTSRHVLPLYEMRPLGAYRRDGREVTMIQAAVVLAFIAEGMFALAVTR